MLQVTLALQEALAVEVYLNQQTVAFSSVSVLVEGKEISISKLQFLTTISYKVPFH